MTTDPLAFLRAAHTTAEARAEAAAARAWSGEWEYDHMVREIRDLSNGNELAQIHLPEIGHFVEANDPAAVLRHIEAERKQIELHATVENHGRFSERGCDADCDGDHYMPPVCRSCRNYAGDPIEAPCPTVEILAEGWGWTSDTPDPNGQ
ncbi:DUF6221 family protein [Actinacidiphila acididurans]|uniref:Uncharacterized protein n=1 Tax=Actinacidiphila acididurans TaxID=2784346 RepID=A0ABS2U301_9ACTN|nr:DUF6221 family protein [Actinacidiphila acididurans]MBM9509972.1 hypothetical protein [Actinacidiphila acididurans]